MNKRSLKSWLTLIIQLGLVTTILVGGLYTGVYFRDQAIIETQVLASARAHFQDIVISRMWNASHGGVYVVKKPGVASSPYLENPEIKTRDGRIMTLRSPDMMTREMSELAEMYGLFQYKITSLRPLNPNNNPDPFERRALESFESGAKEMTAEEVRGDQTFFRYMAPLETTKECLECHAKHGYELGDIRGGISVEFDITPVKLATGASLPIIIALALISSALIIGLFFAFTFRLMRQLRKAKEDLERLTLTDELTGLVNRNYFFNRLDEEMDRVKRYGANLSLIMIDIDHLKSINDKYGHPMGDQVLSEVARLLRANCRTSDIVARYGGEEFAILIPSMGVQNAALAARRFCSVIEVNDLTLEGPVIKVTISAGVADYDSIADQETNPKDALIREAERALARAKSDGRNRVVVYRKSLEVQLPLS